MKPRLYIETSIVGYLTSRPSSNIIVAGHQHTTRIWWEKRRNLFDVFVSELVVDEAAKGDPQAAKEQLEAIAGISDLEVNETALYLGSQLVDAGAIPSKVANDAVHIAVASVHNMDFLMTWNCSHMANAEISSRVQKIVHAHGFVCPIICTPEELMGDEYVG